MQRLNHKNNSCDIFVNPTVWLKSKGADRILLPLRRELVDLIDHGSSVLEVGCGTGSLLFQAAPKISFGYGIDIDQKMIHFAEAKRREENIDHLSFECIDALHIPSGKFDVSTSTLCLHELPEEKACAILKAMVDRSNIALIADYTKANSALGKLCIELDELISGHYRNYRHYRRNGEIPSCVEKIGATVHREVSSAIEGISIWTIHKGQY